MSRNGKEEGKNSELSPQFASGIDYFHQNFTAFGPAEDAIKIIMRNAQKSDDATDENVEMFHKWDFALMHGRRKDIISLDSQKLTDKVELL